MLRAYPEARPILHEAFQRAVARTLDDLHEKGIEQEPQITDRLMARIEDAVLGLKLPDTQFRSITFTDRGRNSEESRWGADFAGFLSFTYTNTKIVKVFLAQAKKGSDIGIISLDNLSSQERAGLLEQIEKMLISTPECYITVYTGSSIKFVPALSIKNVLAQGNYPDFWYEIGRYVPVIDAVSFYDQHFECLIGDLTIGQRVNFSVDSVETLKRALDVVRARAGQSIVATVERPLTITDELRG